ncbi:hypothetical protein GCM10022239_06230 [Leifsonia bigeumensis]|uniref:Uncharacterized protein n=1 Tax=Leifsonella bigeumensis TaxID=433643 RepID=A0ABP7F6L2_9MICO
MCRVDLDHVESRFPGTAGSRAEVIDDGVDFGERHLSRDREAGPVIGESARSERFPSTALRLKKASAFPGGKSGGLSPSMSELNARDRAMLTKEVGDPSQAGHLVIRPDSQVMRGDPTITRDRGRLGHDQADAGHRA